jgi:hypothetical protein
MLAHALLAVIAATERAHHPPRPGLIALTRNEIGHLFTSSRDHDLRLGC